MAQKIFNFEEEFKLGIDTVDSEHSKLVDMLNDVCTKLRQGDREGAVRFLNETFSSYLVEHFTNEEHFMESIGYPHPDTHRRIHENFKNQFQSLEPRLETADEEAFRAILNDTFSWIITHIPRRIGSTESFRIQKPAAACMLAGVLKAHNNPSVS